MLVIIITLTPLASASHLGNDRIPNYGFENWDSGEPLNWTTPNSDWDIMQVGGEEGDHALMLETDRYTSPAKGIMTSEAFEVEKDDLFLATAWVTSINARETKAMIRGYDDERKRWTTIKTFNPSSDRQHAIIKIGADITHLRISIEAGYVDNEGMGTARSYFDELRIIDPVVDNVESYIEEGTVAKNKALSIGAYELTLGEAKHNKVLIKVSSSGKVIDSAIVEPYKTVELKEKDDTYLVFQVDEIFVNSDHSEIMLSQLLAGRASSQVPTIRPLEEEKLVLYLPFDEDEGIETYDHSGGASHGHIYGAEWVKGMENHSLKLDGLDDYIEFPATSDKFEEGDHTFSLWTRSTGTRDSTKYVLCHYNWRILWQSDNEIAFVVGRMNDQDGPSYSVIADVSEIREEWIHLAGVYKPSESKILLYINGELAGEEDIGKDRIWTDYGNYDLSIGNSRHGVATFFEGMVDDVRIYNRALTRQEIRRLMSETLGLSGISSYQSSISLENGVLVPLDNGFQIKYYDTPCSSLALIDGEQIQMHSLENIPTEQTLFLKNAEGVAVIRLNVESITKERLNLSDIWISNEKANAPILKIRSVDLPDIRAYAPATARVTIINEGLKTYIPESRSSIDLYLGEEKVGSYSISADLAPGETLEQSFKLNSNKAGKNVLKAVVSTDYGVESSSQSIVIKAPINPPLSGILLFAEETGSGIALHMALSGPGIKEETWKDMAQVSIGIMDPFGSRTFYEKHHSISGTGKVIEIPYEEFYEGDEQYIITVKFRDSENSVVTRIAGEDGSYDPPDNKYLLLLFMVPVITYAGRKKYFGKLKGTGHHPERKKDRRHL
ncbi:MAG: hypothetical protein JW705_05985 [Methanosarcinaceae archaeon]|nr:hypothetical protein [Methanosarcinaceae archaeon]